MDSAVPERDLARANLLRVRGDYGSAKAALLAILSDRPGDRDTLSLLARTCEDAGEAEEALKWRGLAGASGAEGPASLAPRSGVPVWAIPSVLGLLAVVIALALAMTADRREAVAPPTIGGRVEAPGTTAGPEPDSPPVVPETGGTIGTEAPTPVAAPSGESRAEARGLARLKAAEGAAPRSLAVTHDPRTDTVTISFAPRPGEPNRREAAAVARAGFAAFATAKTLSLRALRGGDLAYLATASRDRLAAVEADGWADQNASNPDALADALLSEEWSAEESAPAP